MYFKLEKVISQDNTSVNADALNRISKLNSSWNIEFMQNMFLNSELDRWNDKWAVND